MSTLYLLVGEPSITFEQLRSTLKERGSMKKHGLRYSKAEGETEDFFCITDSKNYCWVSNGGDVISLDIHQGVKSFNTGLYTFTRYGRNDVDGIMEKLETMGIKTVSEHEYEVDE